jgi:hypothetical protein
MHKILSDDPSKSTIPWAAPEEWQAVNRAIRFHLDRYPEEFKPVVPFAQKVKHHLESILPFVHELCTEKLRNGHRAKCKLLNRAMAQIKSERNLLENKYIRIIS